VGFPADVAGIAEEVGDDIVVPFYMLAGETVRAGCDETSELAGDELDAS
jgi:hypothetical protein